MEAKVSCEVRQFPRQEFLVVVEETKEIRYFNGRQYQTWHKLEHFIHPRTHKKNFSHQTTYTFIYDESRYRSTMTRYSEFNFGG